MLGVSTYDQAYVDTCREAMRAQIAAYDGVAAAAGDGGARDAFEPLFFNNLVLVLDHLFMHRLRGREGKDGNPANEVRVLAASIMTGGARLTPDKTIRLTPETSVLGHAPGDEIALSQSDFVRLADAYLAEIEARFGAG